MGICEFREMFPGLGSSSINLHKKVTKTCEFSRMYSHLDPLHLSPLHRDLVHQVRLDEHIVRHCTGEILDRKHGVHVGDE